MTFPAFTAIVSGPAAPALQAWAVRSAVALGADSVRFPGDAPSDEAREAAASLRMPLLEGPGDAPSATAVETASLPSPDFLRALLPPAECNLSSRAMESAFAGWAGPGDASLPVDLYAAALRRFRMPSRFEHAVRLTQFAQADDAVRRIEGFRFPAAPDAAPPEDVAELRIPLLSADSGVLHSVLDADGGWRAAMRRLREALLPAAATTRFDADASLLRVYASNRRHEPLRAWIHWRVVRTDGLLLDEGGGPVALDARSCAGVGTVPLSGLLRQYSPYQLLVWTTLETDGGETLSRHCTQLCPPKHLALADPCVSVEAEAVPARSAKGTPEWRHGFRVLFPGRDDESETRREGGHWFRVTLTALAPTLWVSLSAPGLSGIHFGADAFHLESESPVEILVRSERPLTLKAFRRALRVESLFDACVEDR